MADYSYGNQYSTTSYGPQGGAGGGGFTVEKASQEGAGNGTATKAYGKDTLRPVTIKQLNDAHQPHPDADFIIDGSEVTQITFVGQIRNVSQQTTNHTYKFDDGTGTIEVKQWIDGEISANGQDGLVENAYARVWGRIKSFNNKRHIGAHVVRAIPDYNEVQYHLLEATFVHLHFTRGPLAGQKGAADANGTYGQQQQQNGYAGPYADVAGGGKGRVLPPSLGNSAKKIFNCLSDTPQTNEGLNLQDIAVRLRMEVADVNKAADELLNQGMIYTTVDDQTWAILDNL